MGNYKLKCNTGPLTLELQDTLGSVGRAEQHNRQFAGRICGCRCQDMLLHNVGLLCHLPEDSHHIALTLDPQTLPKHRSMTQDTVCGYDYLHSLCGYLITSSGMCALPDPPGLHGLELLVAPVANIPSTLCLVLDAGAPSVS